MARIAGIDLPRDKRIEIGLTYIYGIGRKTANDILKATGAMAKALAELDKETRDGLLRFFGILFKSNLRLVLEGIQEEAAEKGAQRRRRRREP